MHLEDRLERQFAVPAHALAGLHPELYFRAEFPLTSV